MIRKELSDMVVHYDNSQEIKDKVFERLIKFFFEHECFHGESFMQCDSPLLDAPEMISEILDDIIKFDCEYKD